jgi:Arm DNA-binding domain
MSKAKSEPTALSPDEIVALIEAKPPAKRDAADARRLPAPATGQREMGFGSRLSLIVQGGSRRWFTYYRWPDPVTGMSKRERFPLGTLDEIPDVSAARIKALEIYKMVKQGINPREVKKPDKVVIPTFGAHATTFMERHLETLKNKKHRAKWKGSLDRHCGPIWNTLVDYILTADILDVLEPIWTKTPVPMRCAGASR